MGSPHNRRDQGKGPKWDRLRYPCHLRTILTRESGAKHVIFRHGRSEHLPMDASQNRLPRLQCFANQAALYRSQTGVEGSEPNAGIDLRSVAIRCRLPFGRPSYQSNTRYIPSWASSCRPRTCQGHEREDRSTHSFFINHHGDTRRKKSPLALCPLANLDRKRIRLPMRWRIRRQ